MALDSGEIVLIRMQFHQAGGGKVRPAVVLIDSGDDDFVAAPVTSQARDSDFDLAVMDWSSAGLNVPSWVRVHKLTVLPKITILRQLGRLSPSDQSTLRAKLRQAFRI